MTDLVTSISPEDRKAIENDARELYHNTSAGDYNSLDEIREDLLVKFSEGNWTPGQASRY